MSKVKISYDEAVKLGLTKECTECHKVKSVGEFNRKKGRKYGAESRCKKCRANYKKQYYQNNKEEITNRKKQYYQNNKEEITNRHKQYRQEHKEELAKYRQEHKEEKAKYNKQYNQAHKEEIANKVRQYQQTPRGKEIKRKAEQKRRALKSDSFYQPFTQEDKEFCLNYFNHKCPYTGKPLTDSEFHIDHIVALSDKDGIGATAPWNMLLCDASTNISKNNKPILQFINSLPNPEQVYNKIREYIILQAKRYIDIIPEDDITLKTFNITFEELEASF